MPTEPERGNAGPDDPVAPAAPPAAAASTQRRWPAPYAVLLASIVLPASGLLWLGEGKRALGYLFFMLVLGWATSMVAAPEVSFVGRHAGGFFVYALSIMDAYQIARRRRGPATPPAANGS